MAGVAADALHGRSGPRRHREAVTATAEHADHARVHASRRRLFAATELLTDTLKQGRKIQQM
jgi:hypothetical protein